jgi:predicted nucleic acid-binding protein
MIIADTGFWVALLDRRDNLHHKVQTYAATIKEPLISTLPVVTEVCYLLQTRCGAIYSAKNIHLPQVYLILPQDVVDNKLILQCKLSIRKNLHKLISFTGSFPRFP